MNSRIVLLLVLLVLVGVVFLQKDALMQAFENYQASKQAALLNPVGKSNTNITSVAETLLKLERLTHLPPDKRFLRAAAIVLDFDTNDHKELRLQWVGGGWEVEGPYGFHARLSNYPTFEEGMQLVEAAAANYLRRKPLNGHLPAEVAGRLQSLQKNLHGFDSKSLILALHQLNQSWGEGARHPDLLVASAMALAKLTFIKLDQVFPNDDLVSHALAAVLLAKTAGKDTPGYPLSLLAHSMKYSEYAFRQAQSLPASHAWRLFLERDYRQLGNEDITSNDKADVAYLSLVALMNDEDYAAWDRNFINHIRANHALLPALQTGFSHGSRQVRYSVAVMLPYMVAFEMTQTSPKSVWSHLFRNYQQASGLALFDQMMKRASKGLNLDKGDVMDLFERVAEDMSSHYQGPFFTAQAYKEFYSGYFYTAFYKNARIYVNELYSRQGAKEFADYLGNSLSQRPGEFLNWYRYHMSLQFGQRPLPTAEDIIQFRHLGMRLVMDLADGLYDRQGRFSPVMLELMQTLLPHLDSRPEQRQWFYRLNESKLYDYRTALAALQSLLRDAYEEYPYHAMYLYKIRKSDALRDVAEDTRLPPYARVSAWSKWAKLDKPGSMSQAISGIRGLIKQYPHHSSLPKALVRLLFKEKKYAQVMRLVDDWLNANPRAPGLSPLWLKLKGIEAKMYVKNADLAWKEVEPLIKSQYGPAYKIAAEIALGRGDKQTAWQLMQKMVARYPGADSSLEQMLDIGWRAGLYDEVAATLETWPVKVSGDTWRFTVARIFNEIFEKNQQEAKAAFEVLLKTKLDISAVRPLATRYSDPKTGFEMLEMTKAIGKFGFSLRVAAYAQLKKWRGEREAIRWLKENLAAGKSMHPGYRAMRFFDLGYDELIWDRMSDPPGYDDHAAFTWVMRLGSAIRTGTLTPARRRQALDFFKQAPESAYKSIALVLLDQLPLKTLFRQRVRQRKLGEQAFYVGLKYQAKGELLYAMDMFRVALQSNNTNEGEYIWALYELAYDKMGEEIFRGE